MSKRRIYVHVPPPSAACRDRVEKRLFERLAQASPPAPQLTRSWRPWALMVPAMAGSLVLFVVWTGAYRSAATHVTDVQSASSAGLRAVSVSGAVVHTTEGSQLEVRNESDGGTTLLLESGFVVCDVEPRVGRPPFRVRAAGVTVVVLGTRFSVQRSEHEVVVKVERGQVRVDAPGASSTLSAGGSSSFAITPPAADNLIPSTRAQTYAEAQALQASDPMGAESMFRSLANESDEWAALSAFSLIDLFHRQENHRSALQAVDDYELRFANGPHKEDVAWLRVRVLQSAQRSAEASAAARRYLRQFPSGAYAAAARALMR